MTTRTIVATAPAAVGWWRRGVRGGARARALAAALLLLAALAWWRGAPARLAPASVSGLDKDAVPGRELPLIFIGGVPRSGTTLMRAMLDAHDDVRCGQETRVVPRILQMRQHWMRSAKEAMRLEQAGVSKRVLDNAVAAFCLEVIARHGEPAPRLCNKDPLVIKMGTYVLELFPNAKFVFMVRDGRATVHSIVTRKVTITGFDLTSRRQCLSKWNHAVETMWSQCRALGPRCMLVRYETLVLYPERTLREVLRFLQLEWSDNVLHHERYINQPHGVQLSEVERSSDQVVRPVNLEALDKWASAWPDELVRDAASLAPMLSVLGYDPWSSPPRYSELPPAAAPLGPPAPPPPPAAPDPRPTAAAATDSVQ